jgi:hypothetical protein
MARRVGTATSRPPNPRVLVAGGIGVSLAIVAFALMGIPRSPSPGNALEARASATSLVSPSVAATVAGPASEPPGPSSSATPIADGAFTGDLLIADRGNGRIIIVDSQRRILWHFPVAGSLPPGQTFSADDAFLSPDGRTISANEEMRQVLVRIDIATERIVWEFGHYGLAGAGAGYLNTPDDAYPLPNGDVTVADIFNCRVLEIAPDKRVVRQWGHTGVCRDHPPYSYNEPNGDTPLPDGGMLITEIKGSRVVRLDASGAVVFDIHVPTLYPSDAQLDTNGDVVVADYSSPGAVVAVSPSGHLVWRYGPTSGTGRLDHPSLAVPLPNGLVILNDDFRHRVLLLDPLSGRIVWQYGRSDAAGRSSDQLNTPDGINLVPPGSIVGI